VVTIRDVAREAGVSVASASRALNDRDNVTPATRDRIRAAAQRLSYVPHSGARNLTRQKTDSIGVVLPDLFGEFFSELIRGIDRIAYAHGLQLLLSNSTSSKRSVQRCRQCCSTATIPMRASRRSGSTTRAAPKP